MKKVFLLLVCIVVLVSGCKGGEDEKSSSDNNAKLLLDSLESAEKVEKVRFIQGTEMQGYAGGFAKSDKANEFEQFWNVVIAVSDKFPSKDTYTEGIPYAMGVKMLYKPSIKIIYQSGEEDILEWNMLEGIIKFEGKDYYIDKEAVLALYEIFTEYSPYVEALY